MVTKIIILNNITNENNIGLLLRGSGYWIGLVSEWCSMNGYTVHKGFGF